RLDVRVDLAPLVRPVRANFLGPTGKTTLKRLRPRHVGSHGGKGSVDVTRVEGRVGRAQQFDFGVGLIWHKRSGEEFKVRPNSGPGAIQLEQALTGKIAREPKG